MHHRYFRIT